MSSRFVLVVLGVLAGCAASRLDATDNNAIQLAKTVPGVARIEEHPGRFGWQVVMYCEARAKVCPKITGYKIRRRFPVRVVCYCEVNVANPRGWYFEANLNLDRAVAISGNAALQSLYDLP